MLDVFSVLADEGGAQLGEDAAQLGDEGGADEVLYGLLGGGFGEDVDVELGGEGLMGCGLWGIERGRREGTYDILVLLGVMGDLGDGDVTADGLIILGFPFARQSQISQTVLCKLWFIAN